MSADISIMISIVVTRATPRSPGPDSVRVKDM
jgi:hypothetical protein